MASTHLPPAAIRPGRLVLYGAGALLFTLLYLYLTVEYRRATLEDLTAFQASRPFQYRVLVPLAAAAIERVFPVPLQLVYAGLTALFTFWLLIAYEGYLRLFFPGGTATRHAPALLWPLAWNYCVQGRYFYPSDIPAILLFTLGLTSLQTSRWRAFYLVFILASLNRETSCFLTAAFLVAQWRRMPPGRLALHALAQVALWAGIKAALARAFAGNPGEGLFENHLARNLEALTFFAHFRPHAWSHFITFVSVFGSAWVLIPPAWREQPPVLRRLLLVAVPFIAGMTVVGNLHELRIYSELVPVVMALTVLPLGRIGRKLRPARQVRAPASRARPGPVSPGGTRRRAAATTPATSPPR